MKAMELKESLITKSELFGPQDQTIVVIGKIEKKSCGLKEFFTDADTFSIDFPVSLDAKAKALMLGALFLIDYGYFEARK